MNMTKKQRLDEVGKNVTVRPIGLDKSDIYNMYINKFDIP